MTEGDRPRRPWYAALVRELAPPLLAIATALLIGAAVIALFARSERDGRIAIVGKAYRGLFLGAFGGWNRIANTLVEATPYLFAGLAVALSFRCGLFNIGAEGQLYVGSLAATAVGIWVTCLPMFLHLPLALAAGMAAGGIWGAIPGWLRAKTGAHEVINTIMMNYIAASLVAYLIMHGPMRDRSASSQRTPFVRATAALPRLVGPVSPPELNGGNEYTPLIVTKDRVWDLRLNIGFFLALAAAALVALLLQRTTLGFAIRAVGANVRAARYAGISIAWTMVLTMFLSGALAGLAGAVQVLGVEHNMKSLFSSGYGFDSIAVALLAKSNPLAVIPAAIFWGALNNGRGMMQSATQAAVSSDLIKVIQALVILFVAADSLVRWLYRLPVRAGSAVSPATAWGQ